MQTALKTTGQNLFEIAGCPETYTVTYTLSQYVKISICISHNLREHA